MAKCAGEAWNVPPELAAKKTGYSCKPWPDKRPAVRWSGQADTSDTYSILE